MLIGALGCLGGVSLTCRVRRSLHQCEVDEETFLIGERSLVDSLKTADMVWGPLWDVSVLKIWINHLNRGEFNYWGDLNRV